MKKKFLFQNLTESTQKKLIQVSYDSKILTGRDICKEYCETNFRKLKPQTRKSWQFRIYKYMLKIDENRKKLGLEPIHFKKSVDNLVD